MWTFNKFYEHLMDLIIESTKETREERRIDFLTKKHPNVDKEIIHNIVHNIDPTKGSYSDWIVKNYSILSNAYKQRWEEDAYKVRSALENFDTVKPRLSKSKEILVKDQDGKYVVVPEDTFHPSVDVKKIKISDLKDINRIQSFDILYTLDETIFHTFLRKMKREKEEDASSRAIEEIYNDDNWKIIRPLTESASCKYGANTRWCTASKNHNMFSHYNDKGPLYILIEKHTQEKYQFHFQSDQFMDEQDHQIDLKKFVDDNSELRDILTELSTINERPDLLSAINPEKYIVEVEKMNDVEMKREIHRMDIRTAFSFCQKHLEKANMLQNYFIFSENGGRIVVDGWHDVIDFIKKPYRDTRNNEYYENILTFNNYGDYYIDYSYNSNLWEYLDRDNRDAIIEWLSTNTEFDITNDDPIAYTEENDIDEVKDSLTRAYASAYESAITDAYYEETKKCIENVLGKVQFTSRENGKECLVFGYNFSTKDIDKIFEDFDEFSETWTLDNFLSEYSTYLEQNGDLEEPDFDRIEYRINIDKGTFNESFHL